MFYVIDKRYKRVVMQDSDRQKAVDYALKYSTMGGCNYLIAEAIGETKQVTQSVFSPNKNVSLGPLTDEVKYVSGTPISELRGRIHKVGGSDENTLVLATGGGDIVQRFPGMEDYRSESRSFVDGDYVEPNAEDVAGEGRGSPEGQG